MRKELRSVVKDYNDRSGKKKISVTIEDGGMSVFSIRGEVRICTESTGFSVNIGAEDTIYVNSLVSDWHESEDGGIYKLIFNFRNDTRVVFHFVEV